MSALEGTPRIIRGLAGMGGGATTVSLLAFVLTGCGQRAATPALPSRTLISVNEAPASQGTIASILSYSGSVTPRWTVNVMPKIGGTVSELRAVQGQHVDAGDLLAALEHRSLDDQLAQANANISAAQAKLRSLQSGARSEDIAATRAQAEAAQAQVTQATANFQAAQHRLTQTQATADKLVNGPVAQDITGAKLAVEIAKDKLFADQTNFDFQVHNGLMSKEMREAALDADQTAIDQANTQLAKLVAPPRAEDLSQARAAVEAEKQAILAAQAQVAQAEQQANAAKATAAKAANPYTAEDIDQVRAAVEVAQAAARSAQTAVDDARIVAPAAGFISDVPVAVGSLVSPQTTVVTLIAASIEIDATVEEGQVAQIGAGQPARIHSLAASDVPGQVLSVAPQGDARTRKFTVKIVPVVVDSPLRAGMSATVDIQTGRQEEAVLVPRTAVIQRNGQRLVFIDEAGHAKMVPVKIGYSDDNQVQLQSGVEPGAMVILPGSLELADGDAVKPAANIPPAK